MEYYIVLLYCIIFSDRLIGYISFLPISSIKASNWKTKGHRKKDKNRCDHSPEQE